ncbi:MAG: aldo/keto reductase [Candidatus Hodarchaeota archaeon]
MRNRKFGSLDFKVSALGFGAMRLPTKKFLFWKKINEPEAIKMIRYGIDSGINYVDTAYPYHGGKSEIVVGKALLDGYREKVHLVTKLPIWKVKETADYNRFLDEQLEKLQTDHLDIYLFHGMNKGRFKTLKELDLIKEAEAAQSAEKIKHIGFSFHDNFTVFKEIIDYYDKWTMAQIYYNYMDTALQATTKGLEYAASKNIAVVIMGPNKGGRLARKPTPEIQALMNKSPIKRSPADWALQFLWNKPEISCVLSGMSTMQQLKENLESADKSGIGSLSQEESDILESIADIFRKAIKIPCTACEYCMPCPSGVNIPKNFNLLNETSRRNDAGWGRKEYKKLAKDKDSLNTAKDNGNATLCTECKKCMENCPQEINIPEELKKVDKVLGQDQSIPDIFG